MENTRSRLLGALVALMLVAAGCSASDDEVEMPFFTSARLEPIDCPSGAADVECFDLVTEVFDHSGTAPASCRVYALAADGSTDLGEVWRSDGFSITGSESPTFRLSVPIDKPDGFMRWQPQCSPGPPG
ncbi:MAG: hypothetical protein GY720_04710 [bacterium]|nr:hypothetical protein [bacterium]